MTRKKHKKSDGSTSNDVCIIRSNSIGKHSHFPGSRAEKKSTIQEDFLKTGLAKKQKVTELYFNENDAITEVYTHNTELKKRLLDYAARFPNLCQQTDDNGQGGLRFEIDKRRISIRLTAPYSKERRDAASKLAKKTNIFKKDM